MTTSPMAFNPTDGLRNKTIYPTDPLTEDALRDAVQEGMDQLRDHTNNTIIPAVDGKVAKAGDTVTGLLILQAGVNVQASAAPTNTTGTLYADNTSKKLFYGDGVAYTPAVLAPSGGYKIQSGSVSTGSANAVYTITFPTAFTSPPIVTACFSNASGFYTQITIGSISATAVTINLSNPQAGSLHWHAISA